MYSKLNRNPFLIFFLSCAVGVINLTSYAPDLLAQNRGAESIIDKKALLVAGVEMQDELLRLTRQVKKLKGMVKDPQLTAKQKRRAARKLKLAREQVQVIQEYTIFLPGGENGGETGGGNGGTEEGPNGCLSLAGPAEIIFTPNTIIEIPVTGTCFEQATQFVVLRAGSTTRETVTAQIANSTQATVSIAAPIGDQEIRLAAMNTLTSVEVSETIVVQLREEIVNPPPPPPSTGYGQHSLGDLPAELAGHQWPASPNTQSVITVNNMSQLTSALQQNAVRIVVQPGTYSSAISIPNGRSDIHMEVSPGANLGRVEINGSRITVEGGNFLRFFLGANARDVIIDGVNIVSTRGQTQWPEANQILGSQRVAIINSTADMEAYCIYASGARDLFAIGNTFRSDGLEATIRLVNVQLGIVMFNDLTNLIKHNFRAHANSDLIYFFNNYMRITGMMTNNMTPPNVNRMWIIDNFLRWTSQNSQFQFGVPLVDVMRAHIIGNRTYLAACTNPTGCPFPSISTGPGWVVSDNLRLPLQQWDDLPEL